MTEIEMKLLLTRYNKLSRERAIAAYMCEHTDGDECIHHGDEWSDYTIEMRKMKDDLRKDGYKFVCTNIKAVGEEYYSIYEIAAIATAD